MSPDVAKGALRAKPPTTVYTLCIYGYIDGVYTGMEWIYGSTDMNLCAYINELDTQLEEIFILIFLLGFKYIHSLLECLLYTKC